MVFVYERDGKIKGQLVLHFIPLIDHLVVDESADKRFIIARLGATIERELCLMVEQQEAYCKQVAPLYNIDPETIQIQSPTMFTAVNADAADSEHWTELLEKIGWVEVPPNFKFFTKNAGA